MSKDIATICKSNNYTYDEYLGINHFVNQFPDRQKAAEITVLLLDKGKSIDIIKQFINLQQKGMN